MSKIDLNNKSFALVDNSKSGKVNEQTVFKYSQDDDLVTAEYQGGSIRYGKIIAKLIGTQLHMLYQCLTTENELKAGKAIANITLDTNKKLWLDLDWEWLDQANEKGVSKYVEI